MNSKIFLISFMIFLLAAGTVYADKDRLGTAGAMELRIPVGARATALSGAVIANVTGPEALYWNPAGAAATQGYEAAFSYGNWFADMKLNYFGLVATSGGFGSIGASVKVLDIGEWEQTTEDYPEGNGIMVEPSFWVMGLSYARNMTDRVAFGATFNFINESLLSTSATGFALDFGFQYTTPLEGLDFGIVLKSIGPDMRFDGEDLEQTIVDPDGDPNSKSKPYRLRSSAFELPSNILFGVTYKALQAEMYNLNVSTDANLNNYSDNEFRFGGEFAYNDMFFLRGGYAASGQTDYLFTGTFGAGFKFGVGSSALNFDYSYVPMEFFDAQNWFSVKLGF